MQESNKLFKNKELLWLSIAVLSVSVALVAIMADPSDAEAASWRATGDGLTNGKATIYCESNSSGTAYTIYKRSAPGRAATKLFSIKVSMLDYVTLAGYYNGNIFYSVGMSHAIPRTLKVYKTSTKKIKTFKGPGADFQMSGKYLIAMSDPSNVHSARKLYSINMSTCKSKKISSASFGYTIRKGKLYFLKGTSLKKSNYSYLLGVYRSKLTGRSQKRVTKTVRGHDAYMYERSASIVTPSNKYVTVKF